MSNLALDRLNEELDEFVQTLKAERAEAISKLAAHKKELGGCFQELNNVLLHGKNLTQLKKVITIARKLK